MVYDDTHRFLLRLISSQSVLSLQDTKRHVATKTGNNNINIPELIKEVNEKIKPYLQMIKIVKDEITSEQLVVFLSLGDDSITREQNFFSQLELQFFRVLLDKIMSRETRELSEIAVLNLVNNIKVNNRLLSKIDAKRVLNVWCRMRYIEKEEGNYVLGVRGIHEFEGYICRNMPDLIEKCSVCKEIVFRGYNCPVCAKAIHNRCLEACLGKAQKWPCCKNDYIHSQLENLRGQSLQLTQRLETTLLTYLDTNQPSTSAQSLEPTQIIGNNTSNSTADITQENAEEEMQVDEIVNTSTNRRKRKRLESSSDSD